MTKLNSVFRDEIKMHLSVSVVVKRFCNTCG